MGLLRFGSLVLGTATLLGCQGTAIWGHLALLAVSVGIFCSTLSLGRDRGH
jgi:hypothetical protein